MNLLVSVIVPIYNVEKYLAKCLDSIAAQTYSNLQIILVNDGSPDKCREICEKFCECDARFELINKKNGGLASARNAALDVVRGTYVVCVDSDDWIEPNMVDVLLKNMNKTNSDMSVCSYFRNQSSEDIKEYFSNRIDVVSKEEAVKMLVTPGRFYGFAWNKMYKTALIGMQRYDENIFKGEDSPFSCDYILKCKRIVVQDVPLYHYRIDSISISRSKFNVGKMTVLNSYQYIIDRLNECDFPKEIIDMQRVQYAGKLLSLRTNIVLTGMKGYENQLKVVDSQMQLYEKLYYTSNLVDMKHKLAYFLGTKFTFLFNIMCKFVRG